MFHTFVREICKNDHFLCEAILTGYALCEALSVEPLTYSEAVSMAKEMANRDGFSRLTVRSNPECTVIDHIMGGVPRWRIIPSDSGIMLLYGDEMNDAREITTVGEWSQSLNNYINFGARSPNTYFYSNPIPSENLAGVDSIEELF